MERLIALVVVAGVILALGSVVVLANLSRPSRLQAEVGALAGRVERIEALQAQPGDPTAVPEGAVCTKTLMAESNVLQARLSRIASNLHLGQVQITATPELDASSSALQPVRFSLDAASTYPAAVGFLQALSGYGPSVLLDRVDMSSRDTFLRLHLEGRVYCRAPRTS